MNEMKICWLENQMLHVYTKSGLSGNQTIVNDNETNTFYKVGSVLVSSGYECKFRIDGHEKPTYIVHNGLKSGDLEVPEMPKLEDKDVKIECVVCGKDDVSFAIDGEGGAINSKPINNHNLSFMNKLLIVILFMLISWWIVNKLFTKLGFVGNRDVVVEASP